LSPIIVPLDWLEIFRQGKNFLYADFFRLAFVLGFKAVLEFIKLIFIDFSHLFFVNGIRLTNFAGTDHLGSGHKAIENKLALLCHFSISHKQLNSDGFWVNFKFLIKLYDVLHIFWIVSDFLSLQKI